MKKIIDSVFIYIVKSISKDGQVSSTRIASYFILGGILTSMALFIGIELTNAIVMWKDALPYIIPNEHVILFGMILAHHLTLLGINKNAEIRVEQAVQDKLKSHNKTNPKDIPTQIPKYTDESPSDADNV